MNYQHAGMRIDDYVKTLRPNSFIAVGSMTAYYFIGTVAQYNKIIPDIEAYWRNRPVRLHERAEIFLKRAQNLPKDCYKHTIAVNTGILAKQTAEKWTSVYTDLKTRPIIGEVHRQLVGEPRMLCIKVQGFEQGAYWLLSEYERDMNESVHLRYRSICT